MATNLGMIVIAGVVGAGGALLFLRTTAPGTPDAPAAAPVPALASASPTRAPSDPWAAAAPVPASTPAPAAAPPPPARIAPVATDASADVRPRDMSNADLARAARDRYQQDCPAVIDRSDSRNGGFDVICSNGVVLRVHAMDGELSRIGPAGHGRPVRRSQLRDEE